MLSKQEWRTEAERAAARKFGEDNAGWFLFLRYGAAPAALALGIGAAGFGAWWVWDQVAAGFSAPDTSGVPMLFLILVVLLAAATIVAFRPGRPFAMFHVVVIKAIVFGLLWLGAAAYGVGVLL